MLTSSVPPTAFVEIFARFFVARQIVSEFTGAARRKTDRIVMTKMPTTSVIVVVAFIDDLATESIFPQSKSLGARTNARGMSDGMVAYLLAPAVIFLLRTEIDETTRFKVPRQFVPVSAATMTLGSHEIVVTNVLASSVIVRATIDQRTSLPVVVVERESPFALAGDYAGVVFATKMIASSSIDSTSRFVVPARNIGRNLGAEELYTRERNWRKM